MENNNSIKVKEFIAAYWNKPLDKISDETRIEDDLGITGDDAYEFMEEFQKKFDVDLTTFKFDMHFGPEASFDPIVVIVVVLLGLIFGSFGWKNGLIPVVLVIVILVGYLRKTKKENVRPNVLQVKHLIKAASEKKWFYNDYNKMKT